MDEGGDIGELGPQVGDDIEAHFRGLSHDWYQGTVSSHAYAAYIL